MEIILPTTTQGKSNLYKDIRDKVLADGAGGECYKFTIAQNIDVAGDYNKTLDSLTHEKNHGTKFRLGEKNNQDAHAIFDEINLVSRGIGQELKSLNSPNFKNGNEYGFDFSDKGAIDFPTKLADQITLFENINEFYLTFAAGTCPIEPFLVTKGYVMATLALKLAGAVTKKSTADQNHRDAKTETGLRNQDMSTPEINIHKFANFLQSRHKDDGRALGDYGFETSDAPSLEKAQMSGIPIGEDKHLQHIVKDSMMTNMTGEPINVFKGMKKKGIGITIPGFGELAMDKGYSKCIVTSGNLLKPGIVKTIVAR